MIAGRRMQRYLEGFDTLPSGGPSPPLAAMGTRLLVNVTDQLAVLGGIFDGDQAGPGPGDPQERNRYGA